MSPTGPVVIDTGVLLATADADDDWHERATAIDRRDLLVVRPAHCDAFELIP